MLAKLNGYEAMRNALCKIKYQWDAPHRHKNLSQRKLLLVDLKPERRILVWVSKNWQIHKELSKSATNCSNDKILSDSPQIIDFHLFSKVYFKYVSNRVSLDHNVPIQSQTQITIQTQHLHKFATAVLVRKS